LGDSETSVTDFLVNIDVDDVPKAVAFYGSAFGLKVGRRFESSGVELLGGPAPIYLLVKVSGTAAASTTRQVRNYARHWTPVHLDFVVKDIEAAVKKAVSVGATLEVSITAHKWGRMALMANPFGNGYCFVEFLGAAMTKSPSSSRQLSPKNRCSGTPASVAGGNPPRHARWRR
jgi:predicted enzyme related to lactoylglutathione lyase